MVWSVSDVSMMLSVDMGEGKSKLEELREFE
jgi:hypothetical protein